MRTTTRRGTTTPARGRALLVAAFLAVLLLASLAPRGSALHAREAPTTRPSTPSGSSPDPTTHATPEASSHAARYGYYMPVDYLADLELGLEVAR